LEAPYVIVDINFEKHGSDISDYVSNLYTMLTRSETGTLIVDKNLTKIFPNLKTIPTSYVEKSLDADKLAEKLKELSDKRLEELAESINQLEDYKSASPIPPTPPVITADLEGVTKAITQLTTDIENSEISRTNKDNLLQQLGEINKQVKDDADFDHLLDEINKLRA
jgi:mannose-6-phosphate isomerase class I